jgi:hypothetical protein
MHLGEKKGVLIDLVIFTAKSYKFYKILRNFSSLQAIRIPKRMLFLIKFIWETLTHNTNHMCKFIEYLWSRLPKIYLKKKKKFSLLFLWIEVNRLWNKHTSHHITAAVELENEQSRHVIYSNYTALIIMHCFFRGFATWKEREWQQNDPIMIWKLSTYWLSFSFVMFYLKQQFN